MTKKGGVIAGLTDRGFGFIQVIGQTQDIFFHSRELVNVRFDDLRQGDVVNFTHSIVEDREFATFVFKNRLTLDEELTSLSIEKLELSDPDFENYAKAAKTLDRQLVMYFRDKPERLKAMNPYLFEELYAEFLHQDGYEVERIGTPNMADGGVDMIAIKSVDDINFRVAIQCKTSLNRIRAEPIRSLQGVLDRFSAHIGIVTTTSVFTVPAIEETKHHFFRINLHDYEVVKSKLLRLKVH